MLAQVDEVSSRLGRIADRKTLMGSTQHRGELERLHKARSDGERQLAIFRDQEAKKRSDASKAHQAAAKATSASSRQGRISEAQRREKEANDLGKKAAELQKKLSGITKRMGEVQGKLAASERAERAKDERARREDQQRRDRSTAQFQAGLEARISAAETEVNSVVRHLRLPRPEQLRILMLAASPEGDLRLGREQKRIRAAVDSALHRDQVLLNVRPSATTDDLLDGLTKFAPHILHFSGHGGEDLVVFERDVDGFNEGHVVSADALSRAISAIDRPPLLVVLNSCCSARQAQGLVDGEVVPFAVGMADEIDDADAITFAARFYAALADGQSIGSAYRLGRSALELAGVSGSELPTLAAIPDVDAFVTVLVKPSPVDGTAD